MILKKNSKAKEYLETVYGSQKVYCPVKKKILGINEEPKINH